MTYYIYYEKKLIRGDRIFADFFLRVFSLILESRKFEDEDGHAQHQKRRQKSLHQATFSLILTFNLKIILSSANHGGNESRLAAINYK